MHGWLRKSTFSNFSIGDSSETSFPQKPTPEEKGKGYLYPIDNEVVEDLRRITREYVKKLEGYLLSLFYLEESIKRRIILN